MPEPESDGGDPFADAELERRIGRNLLLYQRIENSLKFLLLQSSLEGTPADIERRLAERKATIMRKNMGDVAKAVFEQVLTDDPPPHPPVQDGSDAVLHTRFSIGSHPDNPDMISMLRTRCKEVVDARNDLVHHFLRQTTLDSTEARQAVFATLDTRHDTAKDFRQHLHALRRSLAQHQQETAEFIASEAGAQLLEDLMAEGNILDVLDEVARTEARADGWTLLTTARHRVMTAVPADVERVRARLGRRWLDSLMQRCGGIFELSDEPLPNGSPRSRRAIYRLRRA